MSVKTDLEELEGNKYTKACKTCEHEMRSNDEGVWCYKFSNPPTSQCPQLLIKRNIREASEIAQLYTRFPDLGEL